MAYSFAVTRPVNPPGAEPVLTEEQVWKGLEHKAHDPAGFVPLITSNKTISEEGNKLVREVTMGTTVITENIEMHAPAIVYFEMSTGIRITNVVSHGPAGELLLTYCFANGIPGVPADKPRPSAEELNATIGKAVDRSIAIVRQMLSEGKL
ncbi:DUF1857-domain-containing protein [Mycena maculata]|uniref:DUF1857-domain-containing protein n=1 Tax=Mycena maculata TaxID=230809 RepID=A0AAD7NAE0_9AGAR|nr:DUF1857-domain-containing protein [Mycena maculata]